MVMTVMMKMEMSMKVMLMSTTCHPRLMIRMMTMTSMKTWTLVSEVEPRTRKQSCYSKKSCTLKLVEKSGSLK